MGGPRQRDGLQKSLWRGAGEQVGGVGGSWWQEVGIYYCTDAPLGSPCV